MKRTAILFLLGVACMVSPRTWALSTNTQGLVSYTSFNGGSYTLKPWLGRNIVVLTPTGTGYQTNIMLRIITALDKAYDFYESATGYRPPGSSATTLQGRDTIA